MSITQSIRNFLLGFVKPIPLVPVVPKAKEYPVVTLPRNRAFARGAHVNLLREVRRHYAQDLKGETGDHGAPLCRQERRKIARQMVKFAPA